MNKGSIYSNSYLFLILCLLMAGCTTPPQSPLYTRSDSLPRYDQPNFNEYVTETRDWIKSSRHYLTADKIKETDANTPFELRPLSFGKKKQGILLVHGLGDSPWYFTDISRILHEKGFLVRTILLPGHGSRPADLMLPAIKDWHAAVEHQIKLIKAEVDELWLGGFSTGANLITSYALTDDDISGLLLFSPGFIPRDKMLALAPIANIFVDWLDIDEPTNNYTRYESLSANAAALYYETTQEIKASLKDKKVKIPALIVMSQHDSVIDSEGVLDLFSKHFTNPRSKFIWYGDRPATLEDRIIVKPARIPEERISTFSHSCVLFAPENSYYGRNGTYLMIENGQPAKSTEVTRAELWFSNYGYTEPNKTHARLTWNPYFDELAVNIAKMIAAP